MRRNLAQSLIQHGQVETTLAKAKEVRPFVERIITLARKGTLQSRQRAIAMLGDRAAIAKDEQEKYDAMSLPQRRKVLMARSGRRHRTGNVPTSYNKKKIPFVARSVIHRLFTDVAPKYENRPGGYTRIVRLPKRRIGDNSDLALLQLVGLSEKEEAPKGLKKVIGRRRQKTIDRIRFLEGKAPKCRARGQPRKGPGAEAKAARETSEHAAEGKAATDQGDTAGTPPEAT
jgi:large subunit ribosomal protein L17